MSREFIFRIWDKKSKKFRAPSYFVFDTTTLRDKDKKISFMQLWGYPFHDDGECNPDVLCRRKLNQVVIQQFIGFEDSKRIKMYEGDICQYYNRIGVIKYSEIQPQFVLFSDGMEFPIDKFVIRDIEIIGNIYQNLELLTK